MYKLPKSHRKSLSTLSFHSPHTTHLQTKIPLEGEKGGRPLNLLLKSTPAYTYVICVPPNHWLISISLYQPNLSFILVIRHQNPTKMVNYFYILFIKLQTHKMKFKNIKTKHITSNIHLKNVEFFSKRYFNQTART